MAGGGLDGSSRRVPPLDPGSDLKRHLELRLLSYQPTKYKPTLDQSGWIEKAPGAQITFILVACYTQRNTYFDNGRIFHNKNRNEPWISLAKY